MKRFVTGVLAHVDSGKTTLSESMLYVSGEIRKQGRVDHKDAFLDNNEIERDRGITIFSKQAVFSYKGAELMLVDTPGHVDFSAETERSLNILDYAVLVISGTDGVQNHTETLWELLKKYNIPTFIFVNKMDISQRTAEEITAELKEKLDGGCIDFSSLAEKEYEELAMCGESMMSSFLETGKISDDDIKKAVESRSVFPCFFGSALKNIGTEELLDGFLRFFEVREYPESFGARVFKISEDERGKRLAHLKVTGGELCVRDELIKGEKVNEIRIYSGGKYTVCESVGAGAVCAVTGLESAVCGMGFGFEEDFTETVLEPVLNYSVILPEGTDEHKAFLSLKRLEAEDPQLHIAWDGGKISISLMGEVQIEVLKRIIYERYGLSVELGEGNVAYKETIRDAVEGAGHYEPLRHYAEVRLLLEPEKRGRGIRFCTKCSEDRLDRNWQRLILTHLEEKLHKGVLTGAPITDIKITLINGRAHKKHTEGGDFRQATYRAVRQGLMKAESVLLEPYYKFTLTVPSENTGRAMLDIQNMGGEAQPPEINGETATLTGRAPVAKMRYYHTELRSYTKGRGRLSCVPDGYSECADAERIIAEKGYNPEADLENTPDSVFCSHGAGFTVKWDEADELMHTEGREKEKEKPDEERAVSYVSTVASDEELMRIFEKTYGKIKRDIYTAVRRREPAERKTKKNPPLKKDKYVLIDGYNIIFAWDELKEQAKESLDLARNSLIARISNYQGFSGNRVILVFDAYKVKGNRGETEKIHNVDVVYTKEAETADMYIEKVAHELSKNYSVRVATSDSLEQLIILGAGAVRVSAAEFLKEVEELEEQIRAFLDTL